MIINNSGQDLLGYILGVRYEGNSTYDIQFFKEFSEEELKEIEKGDKTLGHCFEPKVGMSFQGLTGLQRADLELQLVKEQKLERSKVLDGYIQPVYGKRCNHEVNETWDVGGKQVLEYMKKHGVIEDYKIKNDLFGFQIKGEQEFVFMAKN
jgi:hypothetical protein